jgi:hypothetical protein
MYLSVMVGLASVRRLRYDVTLIAQFPSREAHVVLPTIRVFRVRR